MTVITGITTAIRIAKRLDRKYSNLDPTNKFITKFVPPGYRKNVRILKDILITGGVIYDPVVELIRGFQKKSQSPTGEIGKGGNFMEQSKSGRFKYQTGYNNRRNRFPNYCRPSRNRRYS